MTEYILEHEKCTIIATYSKAGKLKRLDAKKGFLADAKGHSYPMSERDIDHEHWKPYIKEGDPFYKAALSEWLAFYKKESTIEYRFQPKDGKALKEIGEFLTQVAGNTEGAIDTWKYILDNWRTLDIFYRQGMDLTFINSQLNKILNFLKNGKQTCSAAAGTNADDYRRGI